MTCTTCTLTKEIPINTDSLIIGQTIFQTTDVYIFVKNKETGFIHQQLAVTDSDGVVTLDMTDPEDYYIGEAKFELWVTLRDVNSTERLDILIAGGTFDCFDIFTSDIFSSPTHVNYASHDLELDGDFTAVIPVLDINGSKGRIVTEQTTDITIWEDQGGNDNHAEQTTVANQPTRGANVVTFDGTDAMLIPDFVVGQKQFTLMAMFRVTGSQDDQIIIGQHDVQDANKQPWVFYLNIGVGGVFFDLLDPPLFRNRNIEGVTLVNTWHLVEVIFDNGDFQLDLDKLIVKQHSAGNDNITEIREVNQPIVVGSSQSGAGFADGFVGDFAGIKIFNSLLDPIQRQQEQLELISRT